MGFLYRLLFFGAFVGVVVLGVYGMPAAWAQQISGVRVAPAIFEETADPGDELSSSLRVTNLENGARDFYMSVRDISGIDALGAPIFASAGEETGLELRSWVSVEEGPVTIRGGETAEISFTITVPENASPGSHFGGIFVTLRPEKPGGGMTTVGYAVGMLMSVQVSGTIREEAVIKELSIVPFIASAPRVDVSAVIENKGNVVVRPRGVLEIHSFFGKKVATLTLNEDGAAVLPRGERIFSAHWEGENGIAAFGRYTGIASLVYGQEARRTLSQSVSFWVIPVGAFAVVGGSILGVIGLTAFSIRFWVRRALRRLGVADADVRQRPLVRPASGALMSTLGFLAVMLVGLIVLFLFFA